VRNFREYEIWQNALAVAKQVYAITRNIPSSERHGLIQQLHRASVSIPSNIAEGSARETEREFSHYLRISQGSAFEVETQLLLAVELGFVTQESIQPLVQQLNQLQRQITFLVQKISKKQK